MDSRQAGEPEAIVGKGPTDSILDRIRSATAEQHRRIEQRSPLVRSDLTIATLSRVLQRFRSFLEAWEPAASPYFTGALEPVFAQRRKLEWLDRDLDALGLSAREIQNREPPVRLPRLECLPQALGSMYVLEGSTLGGRHVARHIERTLGLTAGVGYSYFLSYGHDVAPMWKEFCQILVAHSDPVSDPLMTASAVETFDRLGDWLDGARHA
ncbi:MAG: biliverdin-producing heme oxygenase [Isosphaeraceae bacterium]